MGTGVIVKERTYSRLLVLLPPHRAGGAGGNSRPQLTASTVVGYMGLDAAGYAERGEATMALLPKADRVELVFDSADVFTSEIDAPAITGAKLAQALPNLLEDRLLAEPADCHFAIGPRGNKLPVAVVNRAALTRALDLLAESGRTPRRAYADLYTVPAPAPGTLTVRVERGRGVARLGAHEGFSFDLDAGPPAALMLAVRRSGAQRLQAYGSDAARLTAQAQALGTPVDAMGNAPLPTATDAIDLLQGSFATAGLLPGLPRITARSLRAPALWLCAALATWIIGLNAYWFKLQHEQDAIRQSMQTAFRSAFPNLDPDPGLAVEQARRELRTLRSRAGQTSAGDFTALNAQAARLVASAPLGVVAGIEYRDGMLRMKFNPGSTDAALQNLLRTQAAALGLSLRIEADGAARVEAGS
jgi:general secretion pathway protein L